MSIWCRIGRECTGVINNLHDTSPNIQGYSRCLRFMRDLLNVRPHLLNLGCYTRGGSIIYAKSLSRELIDLCPILHNWKEHQCDSREFSDRYVHSIAHERSPNSSPGTAPARVLVLQGFACTHLPFWKEARSVGRQRILHKANAKTMPNNKS
jgi:hypothetical protein